MKLDSHKLGVVGAATVSLFYTGCSILLSLWPMKMMEMTPAMFHLESFGPLAPLIGINAKMFVCGLLQYAVYSYIFFYLFGYMYNCVNIKGKR